MQSAVAHTELAAHLAGLVRARLLDPLEILLGASMELDTHVEEIAGTWAADLLGADDQRAALTAARLLAALYPSDALFDPPADWWRTPLGRVVALRVGHPGAEAVSLSVASAMLGITRQGVHDLVVRGKLDRHPDGGVSTASIVTRLRAHAQSIAHQGGTR